MKYSITVSESTHVSLNLTKSRLIMLNPEKRWFGDDILDELALYWLKHHPQEMFIDKIRKDTDFEVKDQEVIVREKKNKEKVVNDERNSQSDNGQSE